MVTLHNSKGVKVSDLEINKMESDKKNILMNQLFIHLALQFGISFVLLLTACLLSKLI
jgi:hypothetical protein